MTRFFFDFGRFFMGASLVILGTFTQFFDNGKLIDFAFQKVMPQP